MQETRRQMKESTAPLPVELPPAVVDMKLHYRKKKNERRKRPEKRNQDEEAAGSPLVLEGLGPWLAVIGGITAVALIAMAILFKWGGKSATPKPEGEVTFAKQPESGTEKKDIGQQSKKVVADLKKDMEKRREHGEDPAATRAALEAMKAAGEMPQIDVPAKMVRDEMTNLFAKRAGGSGELQSLEEISRILLCRPISCVSPKTSPANQEPESAFCSPQQWRYLTDQRQECPDASAIASYLGPAFPGDGLGKGVGQIGFSPVAHRRQYSDSASTGDRPRRSCAATELRRAGTRRESPERYRCHPACESRASSYSQVRRAPMALNQPPTAASPWRLRLHVYRIRPV